MTLLSPIWLLLAIPLAASLWVWRLPTSLLLWMRTVGLVLLLLALAGLAVRLPSRAGVVVAVVDRSRSMPGDFEARQLEQIELMQKSMGARDQIAVVSFGEQSVTEHPPQPGGFTEFNYQLGRDASNLHDAVERAASLVGTDEPARMVVLSDGQWTGRDPISAAAKAASRGIPIDFRLTSRDSTADLAIDSVEAPGAVQPREGFMVTAWLRSPAPQSVQYELKRAGQRISAGTRDIPAGLSRLTFRDAVHEPSTAAYTLEIRGTEPDAVPENNVARALVGVEGPKPILLLTHKPSSTFARLLEGGGLKIVGKSPDQATWSLADLSNYSAVIIEEISAAQIGNSGLENLAAWVPQTGSGIMLTGGRGSFGPGGYFKSPIDPILPVSMELRKEHRKLSVAIVVVLDRSGSMAMSVPGGRTKMDLANLGSARVAEMLSPLDEFGAFAVDSIAHEVVPLQKVEDPAAIKSRLMTVDSGGGGIFVYTGLRHAAGMISSAQASTRHIILFSDAADSEEPGDYVNLMAQLQNAGVTVSVIGLGRDTDVDANFLRDIARRGGPSPAEPGRIFFTDDAANLPLLFAQDTFAVARSTFVEEPTPHKLLPPILSLTGRNYDPPPPIGGYNLTYIRPTADQASVTEDEYTAPVVASWQVGAGRALAYTAQVDGQFTGPIASWQEIGDFLTGLARWTAGQTATLPDGAILTQNVNEGIVTVELHLDPGRAARSLPAMPAVSILRGSAGGPPSADQMQMSWTSPDTLAASFPLRGSETAIASVQLAGQPAIALPPVTLPYSPEFKPQVDGRGETTLRRMARATGGKDRLDLASIWGDLSRRPRLVELGPWLLIAAIVLLLLEVLERRTGVFSGGLGLSQLRIGRRRAAAPAATPQVSPPTPAAARPPKGKPRTDMPPTPAPQPQPTVTTPPPEPQPQMQPSVLDALADARRKARQRLQRKP
jgi:Mg-chelatase subunit ChlD